MQLKIPQPKNCYRQSKAISWVVTKKPWPQLLKTNHTHIFMNRKKHNVAIHFMKLHLQFLEFCDFTIHMLFLNFQIAKLLSNFHFLVDRNFPAKIVVYNVKPKQLRVKAQSKGRVTLEFQAKKLINSKKSEKKEMQLSK